MEDIVVRSSRANWTIRLLGCLVFVIGGMLMLGEVDAPRIVAWSSIIFFGGCALVAVREMVDRRPRIVVDDRGILDRTLRVGVIEWRDIVHLQLWGDFVCLELRDPAKYTSRLSPLFRRLAALNRAIDFPELSLNLIGTRVDRGRFTELLQKELAVRCAG